MEFLAFGAFLATVITLLIVGLSSTTKTEYKHHDHENNPRYTQNGWIDASKNYRG